MKIIKRISDCMVLYVGEDLQLNETTVTADWGCHPELCDVVLEDVPDCPGTWLGGCYKYDGEWLVVEGMEQELQSHIAEKLTLQKKIDKQDIIDRISAMEREDICNRGIREMSLYLLQKEATSKAAELSTEAHPVMPEQLLSANAFYVKLKARDNEITELRTQLFLLG